MVVDFSTIRQVSLRLQSSVYFSLAVICYKLQLSSQRSASCFSLALSDGLSLPPTLLLSLAWCVVCLAFPLLPL